MRHSGSIGSRFCAPLLLVIGLATGCASSGTGNENQSAMLRDAKQCDADATQQIGPYGDPGVRRLLIESCMALRGWAEK